VVVFFALEEKRVNLVYENDRWLNIQGQREQRPHQLLSLAHILGGQARRRDVKELAVGFVGHCLSQHGLAIAGRAEEEETFDR